MNQDSQNTRQGRKEREFQNRRREILEAATRIFARKGYHGAAMSEIAKEAEFSTGSLYNFFKNKEELYFTLLQGKIEALEAELEEVYSADFPLDKKLAFFVDTVLGFFDRERDFFRIFVEQRSTFESHAKGQFADIVQNKYEKYLGRMVALMAHGIEDGVLIDGVRPEELALSFLGIINGFIFIFVYREDSSALQDKSRQVLDIFFNGTRKRSLKEA